MRKSSGQMAFTTPNTEWVRVLYLKGEKTALTSFFWKMDQKLVLAKWGEAYRRNPKNTFKNQG